MKVGIQMYSVRNHMAEDSVATMKKVAEIGYKNWETCELFGADIPYNYGVGGLPPAEGKALLDSLGVTVIGCHLGPAILSDESKLLPFLDYQAAVGCWSPGLAADYYRDADDVKRKCELFNRAGERCRERGMLFHYHNHFQEFQTFGGEAVLDIIMANTDPELVALELDTFWCARGGADPIAVMKKHADRLIMLHQKDFTKGLDERINLFDGRISNDDYLNFTGASLGTNTFTEIGTGILPIQSYIDAANAAGAKYFTLEQDFTTNDELDSIRLSRENLRGYEGIEWD